MARILAGTATELKLGNLEARRDWGHAADYVEAMWLILQQERPEDFVVATGESHSVGQFVELAFGIAGLDYRDYVRTDPQLYRSRHSDRRSDEGAERAGVEIADHFPRTGTPDDGGGLRRGWR